MKNIKITKGFLFIISLIFFAAIFRLIPHWPNFTPVAAIAIFSGAYINKKYLAIMIPLSALFLSDLILGFHNTMIAVYISFVLTVSIGFILSKNIKIINILTASVAATALFFLITNLAAWYANPIYSQDFKGLLFSYYMGLPFLINNLLGDIFFTFALFGSFYFATSRYPQLAKI